MLYSGMRAAAFAAAAMLLSTTSDAAPSRVSANSFIITLAGTLGPVLSGSDPAGLNGQSATVAVTVKTALKPYRTRAHSASYHIAPGDVTVTVNNTKYTSTSRSIMVVKLSSAADLLSFKAALTIDGFKVTVSDTSALQSGSWTTAALQHPQLFSPSPQNLTEPASTFTYTVLGGTTVLGVTGTAWNGN